MLSFFNTFLFFAQTIDMKKRKKNQYQSKTDPLGSYTGTPENPWEEPVQDADDL